MSVGQPFSCANSWQEGPRRRPTKTYPILYLINFNHVSCLAQEVHALPTNRGPSKAKHSNGSLRRASSDPKFSYLIPLKRRNNTKQHQAKHLDLGLKVVSTWSLPLSLLSFFMSVFLFCFLSLSLSLLICSFVFFFSLSLSLCLSPPLPLGVQVLAEKLPSGAVAVVAEQSSGAWKACSIVYIYI